MVLRGSVEVKMWSLENEDIEGRQTINVCFHVVRQDQ